MAWYSDWDYRKLVTIAGQAGAGTNYQVKLKVGESSGSTSFDFHVENHAIAFPSAINTSGDLRFTDNDGSTLLSFWVESVTGTTPNRLATIWVKVADTLESNANIYCYYGKSGASEASNGANTFILFNDGTSLTGLTDVTAEGAGLTWSINSNKIRGTSDGASAGAVLYFDASTGLNNYRVEVQIQAQDGLTADN